MAYRKTAATAARREARRTVLLDAATRMFASHGYHGATVPMIVAEAGSSVGSFYVHFRNKEDIFAAVLEALGRKLAEIMKIDEVAQPNPLLRIAAFGAGASLHSAQSG
jgi:AcrR family transcriptional regulator